MGFSKGSGFGSSDTTSTSITSETTIKQDNLTYGGVTRVTVGVTSLTLPKPNNTSAWVDTTVNLPANSALRFIFLEKTTPGVNANGTLHLSNVAIRSGGTTPDSDYDLFYGDWDVPGGESAENGYNLEGAAGDSDYTGHWAIHFPLDGTSGHAVWTQDNDIWLIVKAVGNASGGTAPVVSLFVVYDTYDLSQCE